MIVEASGLRVRDARGREYLDATSGGVWCVNVGYGRAEIAQAVYDQLVKMPYFSPTAGNVPAALLAEKLSSHEPSLTRAYYSSSGSEANEKAFKIARLLSSARGNGKERVLYRDRDYHGTTIGALSAAGQGERRSGFGPFAPGFVEAPAVNCYRCPFGKRYPDCSLDCARAVGALLEREEGKVGAAIFETVVAGGGIIVPPPEYWPEVAGLVRAADALLILDEVVTGVGRTGEMFAFQRYGIRPDIVTLAKGLASAYMPISVTWVAERVFEAFRDEAGSEPDGALEDKLHYFRDISTFGGSAAAPAAALACLRIIEEENLLSNVRKQGELLLAGLKETLSHPWVGDARGVGLLCGVEFVADKKTRAPLPEERVVAVAAAMASKGVLVGRTNRSMRGFNNIINFAPAYIATKEDVETIVRVFNEALREAL
jgi:taurine-pyruvate aminotransferase